jgi:glucose/arabinose dehydrogenase
MVLLIISGIICSYIIEKKIICGLLMYYYNDNKTILYTCQQSESSSNRYLNPNDINIVPGYKIEVFAEGLNSPSSILFTDAGEMLIADSGYITGNPSVSHLVNGQFELLADDFNVPLTGINYRNGDIYVSHKGMVTVLRMDGSRIDLISGLPSCGDYSNSRVAFGPDNKLYFGLGTLTNSGVVGLDNLWVKDYPCAHDVPGSYILLNGQNFATNNMLLGAGSEIIYTGAFTPFGETNDPHEIRKGVTKASGSMLRANLDGTNLELVAWGLRSPSYVKFDERGRLYVSNNGYDIRGSRPIANAPDEFHYIEPGQWYGWPDYAGGEPVTLDRFRPEGGKPIEFLLMNHPNVPPKPYAAFPPESTIIGFEFNYNTNFGARGEIFITEFGSVKPRTYGNDVIQYASVGHKISRIDTFSGAVTTFAINKSGFPASITKEGGFDRPCDIDFGPDGAMYVVDMGINDISDPNIFIPNSGVIWRIYRSS